MGLVVCNEVCVILFVFVLLCFHRLVADRIFLTVRILSFGFRFICIGLMYGFCFDVCFC